MKNALIVSGNETGTEFFRQILSENGSAEITSVKTAGEARRLLIESEYSLCIINAPLADENGIRLSMDIMQRNLGQVILAVKSSVYEAISSEVEEYGVFTISKPIDKRMFWNILKICKASLHQMRILQNQNTQLSKKIEDIKMIDRAKCTLMEFEKLSENQAHKQIEKRAMNARCTRRAMAQAILTEYNIDFD